jgi:hypothetical protein
MERGYEGLYVLRFRKHVTVPYKYSHMLPETYGGFNFLILLTLKPFIKSYYCDIACLMTRDYAKPTRVYVRIPFATRSSFLFAAAA